MKKIILASASPQRRKLMEILGLPFTVKPSQAREATTLSKDIAHLVKRNALLKARDIATPIKSAVIIGADTVVYSAQKRLILKPKNLAEAKHNLKELMAGPHWVYSGIAVVDTSTGKALVDYERTKEFMSKLSDQAIDR